MTAGVTAGDRAGGAWAVGILAMGGGSGGTSGHVAPGGDVRPGASCGTPRHVPAPVADVRLRTLRPPVACGISQLFLGGQDPAAQTERDYAERCQGAPGLKGRRRPGPENQSGPRTGAAVSSRVPAQGEWELLPGLLPQEPTRLVCLLQLPGGGRGHLALGFWAEGGAVRDSPNQNTGRMSIVWEQLSTFP